MKLQELLFILFFLFTLLSCRDSSVKAEYDVIPLPQEIKYTGQEQFKLSSNTRIIYQERNDTHNRIAGFLSEYIYQSTRLALEVSDEKREKNAIILQIDSLSDKKESYKITINKNLIVISGSDDAGLFYGVQTLRKSIPANTGNDKIAFPAVEINDYPRFSYRGMMLDVSRHFHEMETIKEFIDILALHNINRFHWHLTDDQGWRIEIKKYPELTEIASERKQTVKGKNTGFYDATPHNGFYTQDQLKEIVEYAQERFITIIPEIDLPGHMLAALTAFPHLGCTAGPYQVAQTWGVFDDVLCAGNEDVYIFLEDVFTEIIELFPSEYIHIGGDECPKTRWEACPKCQEKIKNLGLKADADYPAEEKLQSYVIQRIEKFINSKGRRIIGWDEILQGGIAPNATVMSWRGTEGGIAAAKMQHDVIMVPASHLYFDYYQSTDIESEPFGIGGYIPIETVYNFEPVPQELTPEESNYIIGTQANLWTEYIADKEHLEYMLLPRLAALSEVQWTMPGKKDYNTFLTRLDRLAKLYEQLDYNYARHLYDIIPDIMPDKNNQIIKIAFSTFDNAPIYYTLDGTEPDENSLVYEDTIKINASTRIKAIARRENNSSRVFVRDFTINKATFKDIILEEPSHPRYTFSGAGKLVDGIKGRNSYNSGEWLGFIHNDLVAIIDLGEETDISEVLTGNYIDVYNQVTSPREYIVEISSDGTDYKEVFRKDYPQPAPDNTKDIRYITASFPTSKGRYVKVTAVTDKSLSEWAPGKGNPGFIFVDEIIVN